MRVVATVVTAPDLTPEDALARARELAGGRDIRIGGSFRADNIDVLVLLAGCLAGCTVDECLDRCNCPFNCVKVCVTNTMACICGCRTTTQPVAKCMPI